MSNIPGLDKPINSITDDMCGKVKTIFEDKNDHQKKGGLKTMGESMKAGMVLVMSLWDDHAANMIWLDAVDPPGKTGPGGPRGTCP
jgi:cellulose 1,4-beta-cellobiosidase